MSLHLPASASLAWWLTAWLRGHAPADDLLDEFAGDRFRGLGDDPEPRPVLDLLALLRTAGADGAGLALPVEGDLVGLGGPRRLNDAAIEAGEAVVVVGVSLGLVPEVVGDALTWTAHPAHRRQLPDVGEADRGLRAATMETAGLLADLDVARWRPEVADELMNLRHRPHVPAPPGTPARCVDLAARALQGEAIVALALQDDGGALSAYEVESRRQALVPLGRAARRALVAACSPEVWPEG